MKKILLALFFLPLFAHAQVITTIAGCGIGDDSLATKAELALPYDVAIDDSGRGEQVCETLNPPDCRLILF